MKSFSPAYLVLVALLWSSASIAADYSSESGHQIGVPQASPLGALARDLNKHNGYPRTPSNSFGEGDEGVVLVLGLAPRFSANQPNWNKQ